VARTARCTDTTRAGRLAKAQQFWSAAQTIEAFADDEAAGGDEPVTSQRSQLADRHAVARHDEGLARIEPAHDLTAVIAQLPVRDLLGHTSL
jgi:hypothetical protein